MNSIRALLFFLLIAFSLHNKAQDVKGVEESGIIYRNVMQGGASLHSRGLGLHFRKGHQINAGRALLYDIALQTVRHPKEVKSVNSFSNNSSGFLYGKLNSLNCLHTGVGIQQVIHEKGDIGGTAVGYSLYGGISWGLLKPVYLYIFYQSDLEGIQEKLERYDPAKHFPDNISGRASFLKGLAQSRLITGAYGAFQFNFDFGKQETAVRMLETGVSADVYPVRLSIMADEQKGQFVFFNFFIRYIFGKKWNYRHQLQMSNKQ